MLDYQRSVAYREITVDLGAHCQETIILEPGVVRLRIGALELWSAECQPTRAQIVELLGALALAERMVAE